MDRQELINIRLDLIKRHFILDKDPTLVAVSKGSPFSDIEAAYRSGQRHFGENRVDELFDKSHRAIELGIEDIHWHFLGHLQSNKIKKLLLVPNIYAIHSVDSSKLLDQLISKKYEGAIKLFLQVNTSNEQEKYGFRDWDELALCANKLLAASDSSFSLYGLMTMSRLRTDTFEEDAKKCFRQLKVISDSLVKDFDLPPLKLSMGMSDDFEIALNEGSDYLRIGSKIFSDDPNARG